VSVAKEATERKPLFRMAHPHPGERDTRLIAADQFCEHGRVVHRDGFSFSTEVRVRFAETDAQGIVHNSNYFIWFEVARVEYLERYAGGYQRLRDLGVEALVLETHVRYLQPAKFDDRLVVHARCLDVRGARFRYEYAIERSGELLADGWTAHATVDSLSMRPTRVPPWLSEAIFNAEGQASSSS
jgi:acyl-CoA thioester hydrolase